MQKLVFTTAANTASWEWSRWEASDIDGRTREGEPSGTKANQAAGWTALVAW